MEDKFLATELLQALVIEQLTKSTYVLPVLVHECYVHPPLQERLVDFRHETFQSAFERLNAHLTDSRQAFVVMKFGDDQLDSAYNLAIRPTLEKFGFAVIRIDEVQNSGSITDQILMNIQESGVVLADLTGGRPNCYFEVGYALALDKELILTCKKGDQVHFDLGHRKVIYWSTELELRDALLPRLTAVAERARRGATERVPDAVSPSAPLPLALKKGAGGS